MWIRTTEADCILFNFFPYVILYKGGVLMTKKEVNIKAKEVFDWYCNRCELIEAQAKKDGVWQNIRLDSNQYLFKSLMMEVKNKLDAIRESID